MIKVVAWDFDGVLNRNVAGGDFSWSKDFEADIGQSFQGFADSVIGDTFHRVLTGQDDLRDRISDWARQVGCLKSPDEILDYWFAKDARPDAAILSLVDRLSKRDVRQVIVTNNDPYRTRYIESDMGFGHRVERIFSSGDMGVAKPDPRFL